MSLRPRYIFVGGLHRSGTSLVSRLIAGHPHIASIQDAPVPEQEGVYLQGAIPHTACDGQPGSFANDTAQHLTERSAYNSLEVQTRLGAEWDRWYVADRPWRVEKSPVNLLRARLYQQLFPTAQFVFVTRHPAAVSAATAKWSPRSPTQLLAHWKQAHTILTGDLPYLHAWMILRYEDLCADVAGTMQRVFRFMDLEPSPSHESVDDRNVDYFRDWDWSHALPDIAEQFGYRAGHTPVGAPTIATARHYFRSVTEAVAR